MTWSPYDNHGPQMRYRCCGHCVDDPGYHADNPPNSHDVSCSYGGFRCDSGGDVRVPYEAES